MKNELELTKKRLILYYEAERAILSSQSYTIGTKILTRADLKKVQDMIDTLEKKIDLIERGGKSPVKRIIPMDL